MKLQASEDHVNEIRVMQGVAVDLTYTGRF